MRQPNGFTRDVITLLTAPERSGSPQLREAMLTLDGSLTEKGTFLRENLIEVLSPIMLTTPPFVQQIVARALVDHVDWAAVARRAQVSPEEN